MSNKLAIILPCYNEEEVLQTTSNKLLEYLNSLIDKRLVSKESFILFVDDGSADNTKNIIKILHEQKPNVFKGISFSKNFGHQNALVGGMTFVKDQADIFVTIDADLQDDYTVIEEMINKYNDGYEVVFGVRKKRDTDSFFKRFTANSFYKIMNVMGAKTVDNHADFRLLSKRAVGFLLQMKEVNLFLRGMVVYIGLKNAIVYYDRKERIAGESKYPLRKMISFAFNGITSFSTVPLRMILYIGLIVFGVAIVMTLYTIYVKFFGYTVRGWASTVLSLWFLGGVELIAIGIIGEYLGKLFIEVKNRPKFFIEDQYWD